MRTHPAGRNISISQVNHSQPPGLTQSWIIELLQSFIHLTHLSFLPAANKKGCNLNILALLGRLQNRELHYNKAEQ